MKKTSLLYLSLLCLFILWGCGQKKEQITPEQTPKNSPIPTIKPKNIPTSQTNENQNLYIGLAVVNVYKEPKINSETVTQALYGESVKIIQTEGEWVKVKLPDQYDYSGWLQISQLRSLANNPQKSQIVAVINAVVYSQPDINSNILNYLPMGTVVHPESEGENSQFTRVKLLDGNQGFIPTNQIVDYEQKPVYQVNSDRIIATAQQLQGVPYLWGGMTTNGVDCSGFVHTVFKVHGIKLHRDADLQYAHDGVKVDITELKPGDLLFFSTYKKGASHEGIYIGDRKFIHASSSQGVGYNSLDDEYYKQKFVGAKRILN
jgi:gamma-D-glutamyl-L-lysine dipeptidyl-peptidase